MITIFPNITSVDKPSYITVAQALDRIKSGRSKELVEQIRACASKDERNNIKKKLPCVVFTGKFERRHNDGCIEPSKLIILDFDNLADTQASKKTLIKYPFIYACWVSPSGTGLKALVRVSTNEHVKHFKSLETKFKNLDSSGKDLSRVCYESWDPEIYINDHAEVFKGIFEEPKTQIKIDTTTSDYKFSALIKWLADKGSSFVDGNRNNFIFRLTSACNRIGMPIEDCKFNIRNIISGSGFEDEATNIVSGVYKRYEAGFGRFEMKDNLVFNKESREDKTSSVFDMDDSGEDIITLDSIWNEFMQVYRDGIIQGDTTHIPAIDPLFRWMKGQTNLMHGYGNFGKTTFFAQRV